MWLDLPSPKARVANTIQQARLAGSEKKKTRSEVCSTVMKGAGVYLFSQVAAQFLPPFNAFQAAARDSHREVQARLP
jgi:hypothetical protein